MTGEAQDSCSLSQGQCVCGRHRGPHPFPPPRHPDRGRAQAQRDPCTSHCSLAPPSTRFSSLELRDWARWASGQVRLGFWPQGPHAVMGLWATKALGACWLCFQVTVWPQASRSPLQAIFSSGQGRSPTAAAGSGGHAVLGGPGGPGAHTCPSCQAMRNLATTRDLSPEECGTRPNREVNAVLPRGESSTNHGP